MPILREHIQTSLPIDEAFAFVADFANSKDWDPGVATASRIGDGPLGVGARFDLGVQMRGRVTPMEYEITTFDSPNRVVLTGSGSGVAAVDDIRFQATEAGTDIEYVADIRLRGLMRIVEPFVGGAFAEVGRNARDGMQRKLAEIAAGRQAP